MGSRMMKVVGASRTAGLLTLAAGLISPQRAPPPRRLRFVFAAEPTLTFVLINLSTAVVLVERHVVNALAAPADVALDQASF